MYKLLSVSFVMLYITSSNGEEFNKKKFPAAIDEKINELIELRTAYLDKNERSWSMEMITDKFNRFVPQFYKSCIKSLDAPSHPINTVFSPYGLFTLLSMLSYGSRGSTKDQFRAILGLPPNTCHELQFQTVVNKIKSFSMYYLWFFNSILYRAGSNTEAEFRTVMNTIFSSEEGTVVFIDSVKNGGNTITWSTDPTHADFEELVASEDLVKDTDIVLVSIAHFNAELKQNFHAGIMSFWINSTTRLMTVPKIYQQGNFSNGYLADIGARFVEIPCESGDSNSKISIFIILPDDTNGLERLQDSIEFITMERLLSGNETEIFVEMPSFTIENKIKYNKILKDMKLDEMFQKEANLSGINGVPGLKVRRVIQKVVLDVKGAIYPRPIVGPKSDTVFNADHPFMILVGTTDENPLILFIASYIGITE